ALGAEEVVPWAHRKDPIRLIKTLKKQGVQIVALEITEKAIDYRKFKPRYPVCLVLGHEVDGVPQK
ncbi:TrmH family RNA methyltransferase, partial [Candidatus Saccharibacteria bacterium]|nr:TrmH family RNA methyltransferase [Candidatus Saccharibacteria bacterium]NIW79179.1 TrmH family RNA methyltransferase [Calditrichia bacterium]